jgi:osmotically-inducible protein OsmY
LGGRVANVRARDAATREAWATEGVVDVKNELRVVNDGDE